MRFSTKLIIAIVVVVSFTFSIGGTLMISLNFKAAQKDAVTQSVSRHKLSRYTLESKMLSDKLKGEEFATDALAKYADELATYASEGGLCVVLADGTSIFSDLDIAKRPADNTYIIKQHDQSYMIFISSSVSVDGNSFTVTNGYDISAIYRERERQYITFMLVEICVLICAALGAWLISRAITRPLRTLEVVSKKIADGAYDLRTGIYTHDEIGEFSKSFDSMVDSMQDELDKRTAFVANFSHELKTPMTSMIGYADILRSRTLSEDDKFTYADSIYKNSKRLETLSTRMMSMLGMSEEKPERKPVTTAQISKRLDRLLDDKRVEICLAPTTVLAEEELLLVLLRNLIENALKASDGKMVSVTGIEVNGKYSVSVSDSGKGMSADQMRRATEPFYKADRSRSDGGFGIGLSICSRICELHGTELSIQSSLGYGTTISFTLEVCCE